MINESRMTSYAGLDHSTIGTCNDVRSNVERYQFIHGVVPVQVW